MWIGLRSYFKLTHYLALAAVAFWHAPQLHLELAAETAGPIALFAIVFLYYFGLSGTSAADNA